MWAAASRVRAWWQVQTYTVEVMRQHAPEVKANTPIGKKRLAPRGRFCPGFRLSKLLPGQKCSKSNCKFFPCVALGTEKELGVRRLFEADPEVNAWRAGREA